MAKYADSNGLLYLIQLIKGAFALKSHTHTASEAPGSVTGVKGNAESTYRTGDVNITPANVGAAPTSHATNATTYGAGTSSNYGHLKLSDATDGTAAAASGGTAATPKAVKDALTAAKTYADTAGVYGVKGNGETSYRTGQVNITPANVGAAPTAHASSATTYGAGTNSNYGHVKLSDAVDGTAAAASGGTAATPKAVADALAAAKNYADSNDADTKNTAGSTDSSSKLFLIGAESQAANPQTYSQDTAYVGTDGHLYSDSKQVVNLSGTQAITGKTYNGLTLTAATTGFTVAGGTTSKTLTVNNTYTLGAACAKGVDTSISAGSTSTNLPTTKAVVDYLAGVAGALVYKGTVSAESSLLNVALKVGWFYIVSMPDANTSSVSIAGQTCEAGDMVIVNTAGTYTTSSGLAAAVDVIQSNIEALTNAEIDTIWASAFAA